MPSEVAPSQWWVQLVDSSPLENHDELRTECGWFGEVGRCRFVWDRNNPTPTAISVQGSGPPPNVYDFLCSIQHLMGRNEYMVFVIVVEMDTLDKGGIYHVILARHTLAKLETGRELLAKTKATVLDVDEELAAGT